MIVKKPILYNILLLVCILFIILISLMNISYAKHEDILENIQEIIEEKDLDNSLSNVNNKIITTESSNNAPNVLFETNGLNEMGYAKIIVLNKITAKPVTEILKINQVKIWGNLSILVKKCFKNSDLYNINHAMLISIDDARFDDNNLFKGWLFSANPSISTFEHPVYEIIPLTCFNK